MSSGGKRVAAAGMSPTTGPLKSLGSNAMLGGVRGNYRLLRFGRRLAPLVIPVDPEVARVAGQHRRFKARQ